MVPADCTNVLHLFMVFSMAGCYANEIYVTFELYFGLLSIGTEYTTVGLRLKNNTYQMFDIGKNITVVGKPSWKTSFKDICVAWENGVQLSISWFLTRSTFKRLNIQWLLLYSLNKTLIECFDMDPYNWYGGGEMMSQHWPIQYHSLDKTAFVPGYDGNILDPYFLTSAGISLRVDRRVPLFVSIEGSSEKKLCFHAEFKPPYRNTNLRPLKLTYTISYGKQFSKALWVNDCAKQLHYSWRIPSFTAVRNPVWSTWFYKNDVNQVTLLNYVRKIHGHHLPGSYIEIRHSWESCYGDETFDLVKFPNTSTMLKLIKELGFQVSLWIHPFISHECHEIYNKGLQEKHFVTVGGYKCTGNTTWLNNSTYAIIDVTNQFAVEWWLQRLFNLKMLGITSFKFDGDAVSFLPDDSYLNVVDELQPGYFTTAYAEFASTFGDTTQIGGGFFTQTIPNFFAIKDRYMRRSMEDELRSIIVTYLNVGIAGYPYISPGCLYGDQLDREFYIRWMQLSTFLPVMYICVPPWTYDNEVTEIVRKLITIHANISKDIIDAMSEKCAPIIRPLWWIDASDSTSQTISDEFLVGSKYMVAPILKRGAAARDIYLPSGNWTDFLRGISIQGPTWLYDYSISLNEVAYFQLRE
ncbi:hypothetical protein CHUAL_004786 [Chamberlinius hualienensis]